MVGRDVARASVALGRSFTRILCPLSLCNN
jgi:hypothetical protein